MFTHEKKLQATENFIYFIVKYDKAVACKNALRSQSPKVYNSKRIKEKPIPNTVQRQNQINDESEEEENDISEEEEIDNLEEVDTSDATEDPLGLGLVAANNSSSLNIEQNLIEVKEEMVLFNIDDGDQNEINNILENAHDNESDETNQAVDQENRIHEENEKISSENSGGLEADGQTQSNSVSASTGNNGNDSDDSIVFDVADDDLPRPIQCSLDGLIKRENDPFSGNLAFAVVVRYLYSCSNINSHINIFH